MDRKFVKAAVSAGAAALTLSVFTAISAFAEDADAAADTQTTTQASTGGAFLQLVLPLLIMFGLLYFIAIRPQKKRDRELKEMQDGLQVGDEVVTIGGIVGIIVSTAEDTVLLETGGSKNKIRIKSNAISENITAAERYKEAQAEAKKKKAEAGGLSSARLVDDEDDTKKSKKKDKKAE